MSYILDALRRAESERARGGVPGLHSVDAPLPPEAGGDGPGGRLPLAWAALALLALAGTAGLAWWAGRGAAQPGLPAHVVAAPPPPGQAPMVAPAPQADPARVPAADPAPARPAAAAAPPAPSMAPAPRVQPAPPPGPTLPPPIAKPPAVPKVTAAPLAAAKLPSVAELPATLRAQLPPLSIAGGMYADAPAQRLVILNGQVAREGDEPMEGLKVEQIRRRSVVFSLRGQRFEVPM